MGGLPRRRGLRGFEMPDVPQFSRGDVIIHTGCPQWGDGLVDEVVNILHEGKAAQRLIVKFANKGRVTLNSAVAPLISKDAAVAMNHYRKTNFSPASAAATTPTNGSGAGSKTTSSTSGGGGGGGWLSAFEKTEHELHRLPDALNDPFLSLVERIEATLDTYQFSKDPRVLIDWAIRQTKLNDPMTKYTRHELEVGFDRFARDRDVHLRDLLRQLKQQGRLNEFDSIRRKTKLPAAVSAMDRARNQL